MKRHESFLVKAASALVVATMAMPAIAGSYTTQQEPVVYAPPAPPAPVLSWSGFYLGAHAGVGRGRAIYTDDDLDEHEFNFNGVLYGVHAGANMQSGQFVFGVEGDWSRTNLSDGPDLTTAGRNDAVSINSITTLRARAGIASGNWLFYGTAGLAMASMTVSSSPGNPNNYPGNNYREETATANGWAAGLGVETMLTNNVSARIEYLHVNVRHNFEVARFDEGPTRARVGTLRLGVSYRF